MPATNPVTLLAELVEMLVWERDKIMQDGPGRDLSDLNLGSDESSSAVLNVGLHAQPWLGYPL